MPSQLDIFMKQLMLQGPSSPSPQHEVMEVVVPSDWQEGDETMDLLLPAEHPPARKNRSMSLVSDNASGISRRSAAMSCSQQYYYESCCSSVAVTLRNESSLDATTRDVLFERINLRRMSKQRPCRWEASMDDPPAYVSRRTTTPSARCKADQAPTYYRKSDTWY